MERRREYLSSLDLRHFGDERGGSGGRTEQGSNGREVVIRGMGGLGVHHSLPRPYL